MFEVRRSSALVVASGFLIALIAIWQTDLNHRRTGSELTIESEAETSDRLDRAVEVRQSRIRLATRLGASLANGEISLRHAAYQLRVHDLVKRPSLRTLEMNLPHPPRHWKERYGECLIMWAEGELRDRPCEREGITVSLNAELAEFVADPKME